MAVPPAPVRVANNDHLPRVSRQSRRSSNDKGNNEVIPVIVRRSPGIYLTAEENTGKPHLRESLMKAVRPFIALNGVPYFQMRSVGSHRTLGRDKKGKKEKADRIICNPIFLEQRIINNRNIHIYHVP